MKKLLLILLSLCLVFSCTAGLSEAVTIDPNADRGIVPKGADAEGKYAVNPVISGESPVTGLPYDGQYIPILVNIDNIASALPQWGIAEADIIYELPIDRIGMTRLMALYATNYPEKVGPVRSARMMHAELRQEWDAAWMFCGGQEAKGTNVYTYARQLGAYDEPITVAYNLQGTDGRAYSSNVKHHESPHNHQGNVAALMQDLLKTGYQFPARPYLFTDEVPVSGDSAAKVIFDFGSGHSDSYYVYNAEENTYYRYRTQNNKGFYDMDAPDVTLDYENVIVQWTSLTYYESAGNRPLLTEVGSGNADIFTGGRHISAFWVRTDENSRTIYFDQDGNEISLQRGKTWITLASDKFLSVSFEK